MLINIFEIGSIHTIVKKYVKKIYIISLINIIFSNFYKCSFFPIIKNIEINGNERILRETILMFADIENIEEVNNNLINSI